MKHNPLMPYLQEGRVEAGCDEAGRGCLAGPVYAAAVILSPGFSNPLSPHQSRRSLEERIVLKKSLHHTGRRYDNIDQLKVWRKDCRHLIEVAAFF